MLETDRLILRPLVPADAEELVALQAEPSFWWYPFQRGFTADESRAWLDATIQKQQGDGFVVAAVVERSSGRLAGWAGLSVPHFLPAILPAVEVGWRLGEAFWGQGYATEAGAAWVDHGFAECGLAEIISIYEPANRASGAVMTRLGFHFDQAIDHPERGVPLHIMKRCRAS